MKTEGAKIIITGAGYGVGAALLKQLSTHSCQIIATNMEETSLQTVMTAVTAAKFKARISAFIGDLSIKENVDELFAFARQTMGGVDIFISCEEPGKGILKQHEGDNEEQMFALGVYCFEKIKELNGDKPYYISLSASSGEIGVALHNFVNSYRKINTDNGVVSLVIPAKDQSKSAETLATAIIKGIKNDSRQVFTSVLDRARYLLKK